MAGIYKRGQSWYLSFVEGGRQVRRSLGAVTEAEAQAARVAHESRCAVAAAAGPTFAVWAARYATWHQAEYPDSYFRVEQILRTQLVPAFGGLPLMALDRAAVEAFKARRLEQVAAGTVVKELRTLQAALNAAVSWEVIPRNPVANLESLLR